MSIAHQSHLLTAEVNWGGDPGAIFWVGKAPVHQFWPRLAPHFGSSLLAPQRKMDGEVVAWTWRESEHDEEIAAAELLALRALLGTSLESFRKAQPPRADSGSSGAPAQNRTNLDLLWDAVEALVADLLAKSDHELLAFVVRSEAGLRIHSWGAKKAALPRSPEQLGHEVSGITVATGKAMADVEVQIKNSAGEVHAKTLSDGTGRFRFPNVNPGVYRVVATHPKIGFPSEGLEVSVASGPVSGLKLRSNAPGEEMEPEDESTEEAPPPRRRKRLLAGLLLAGAIAAAILSGRRLIGTKSTAAASSDSTDPVEHPAVATSSGSAAHRSTSITTTSRIAPPATRRAAGGATSADQDTASVGDGSPGGSGGSQAPNVASASVPPAARPEVALHLPPTAGGQNRTTTSADAATHSTRETEPTAPHRKAEPSSKAVSSASNPPDSTSPSASAHAAVKSSFNPAGSETQTAAEVASAPPMPTWAHRTQMRPSAWMVRLLVDPILPTDPTGDDSPAALEALRKRVLQEQEAALPSTFRALITRRGYTVHLPVDPSASGYRWQLPAGVSPGTRATIIGEQAELSWDGPPLPAAGRYELVSDSGQPRFRLEVLSTGIASVDRGEGVSASYWLQVAPQIADAASAKRFSWQRASGGAVPSSWADADLSRVNLPLSDSIGTETNSDLAFFDSVTGWAVTAQVTLRSLSSAGEP